MNSMFHRRTPKNVELLSSRLLDQARVSFEDRKGRRVIRKMERLPGGWYSVLLDGCPADSTILNVLADSEDLTLRLRLIQEK